jgi:amino acid transporter
MSDSASGSALAREAIGLREVIFQSITHMAPAAAVAFSIPFGISFGGGATPLAVLFALIGSLFVAVSIAQLARHLPSAGSFYTYASRSLHPGVGFLVGWGYAFIEPLVAPILYLNLGFAAAAVMNEEFNWSADLWWPWAIAGAIVVFAIGYLGIRVSAGVGTVLGIFEIGVFALVAVTLIFKADHNTLAVFTTKYANNPDFTGFSGVVAASVYTVLAFIGFEAAAPLAEEAKDPKRTIQLAVIWSAIAIGLYYVLTTYAVTAFVGPDKAKDFVTGAGWLGLGREAWGALGYLLIFLAIVNSTIANANSGANAATRTWFAMGRIRLLPRLLAHVHARYSSPDYAVIGQFVVGLVVALWLGFQYDPITAFGFLATMLVVLFIPMYIVCNLSCILFYWRRRRDEFNVVLHLVIPVLGIAALVPAFLTGAGIPAFSFVSRLSYPLSWAGPIVGIWMGIGIVYLIVLSARDRSRIDATARVFLEEETPEAVRAGEPGASLPGAGGRAEGMA